MGVLADAEVVLCAVKRQPECAKLAATLLKEETIALQAVQSNFAALQYLPQELLSSTDFFVAALRKSSSPITSRALSPELKTNQHFLLACAKLRSEGFLVLPQNTFRLATRPLAWAPKHKARV